MPESAKFEKLPVWKIHGVENSGLELPAPGRLLPSAGF